jgi:cytoskeletal protein RodZ
MYETPPSLRQFNAAVPPQVEAAVMRALAKDPAQRFPSVSAYAQALEAGARSGAAAGPLPVGRTAGPASPAGPAPQWPGGPGAAKVAPKKPGGLGRLWLAALAVVVLLTAVVGVGTYVNHQQQVAAQATQTAQANAALTQQAQASASPSVAPSASASASTTLTPSGPTATAAPATPPPGVGAAAFTSPAPTCDGQTSPTWTNDGAKATCVGATQVDLASPHAGSLACLSAQAVSQNNGYVQATADPQSGKAEVGVRQGVGNTTTGTSFNITGYYLAVDPAQSAYVVYSVDANGAAKTLQQGQLTATPPHPFTFGLMFNGTSLTPYINGQAYSSVTDSAFSGGWTAICTDGSGSFSTVSLYQLGS